MKKGITMDNRKKSLLLLVLGGLFSIVFLTLLTTSFYGYVLKKRSELNMRKIPGPTGIIMS